MKDSNVKAVSLMTRAIEPNKPGTWIDLYYSIRDDSLYVTPAEHRYFITTLIRPNTPEEIRNTVNWWKSL